MPRTIKKPSQNGTQERPKVQVKLSGVTLSDSNLKSIGVVAQMISEQAAYSDGVFTLKLTEGELDGDTVYGFYYDSNDIRGLDEAQENYLSAVSQMLHEGEQVESDAVQLAVEIRGREVHAASVTAISLDQE